MSVQSSLELPLDLLELVVEHASRTSLTILRLVSRSLNNLAGSILFETLEIGYYQQSESPLFIFDQLAMAAAGEGPNVRWTKTLKITRLEFESPYIPELNDSPDLKATLYCQRTVLIPAILAMKNVRCAEVFIGHELKRVSHVISAIQKLPMLEDVTIDTQERSDVGFLILSRFRSLLHFDIRATLNGFHPSTLSGIRRLVKQSPRLTSLTIREPLSYDSWGRVLPPHPIVDFDSFLPSALPTTPALDELILRNERIRLTPTSGLFLLSLAHLVVEDGNMVDPAFWKTLEDNRVSLLSITIYPITLPLAKFLLSSSGLVRLWIFQWDDTIAETTAQHQQHILDLVVPHHQFTLRTLHLGPPYRDAWSLTEDYLNNVLLCTSLQELFVTFHIPSESVDDPANTHATDGPDLTMSVFLRKLARECLSLEQVRIYPSRAFITRKGSDAWGCLLNAGETEFVQLIEGVDLSVYAERCKFIVKANRGQPGKYTTLKFDRQAARFVAQPKDGA